MIKYTFNENKKWWECRLPR